MTFWLITTSKKLRLHRDGYSTYKEASGRKYTLYFYMLFNPNTKLVHFVTSEEVKMRQDITNVLCMCLSSILVLISGKFRSALPIVSFVCCLHHFIWEFLFAWCRFYAFGHKYFAYESKGGQLLYPLYIITSVNTGYGFRHFLHKFL